MKSSTSVSTGQRVCFFFKKQTARLAIRMLSKEHEKNMNRRRFGYGRLENGPDDDRVPEYYNITPADKKQTKKQWARVSAKPVELTKSIDQKWRIFKSRCPIRHPDDLFIRPRVDILLRSTAKASGLDTLNLTNKRILEMPFTSNGGEYLLTGQVDNVVFSGDPDDIDASLLVLRATRRGEARVWTLLKLMAMVHHARKVAGKDAGIYGIATDSHEWAFAHIDGNSQFSCWFLEWEYQNFEIVAHVMRILDYAGARAAAVRATARRRNTSQLTGCRIYDPDERVYSNLDVYDMDDLD
ncbi:hypothetical protein BDW62DRAFT_205709 [Aspergillus aurantiobrunneus]